MPLKTGYTLQEIDQRVKDLLLITDNKAAHWDSSARLRFINDAQGWVQLRTLRVAERRTKFHTFTRSGSGFEENLPTDCLVEVRLFKQNPAKSGEEAWEAVRVIRPRQEDGWRHQDAEEVWIANGQTLRFKGSVAPTGDYRLQYVARVTDLSDPADVCEIDPEFVEGVWTRAAQRCALATSDAALADRLKVELQDWLAQVEEKTKILDSMRSGDVTPRPAQDFHDGTCFRLMERLRAILGPAIPADMLPPDRLRIALNEGQERVSLIVKRVCGSHLEKTHVFTMDGSAYSVLLPKDFKTSVILEQQVSTGAGELSWREVKVIRPTDKDYYLYGGVSAAVVPEGTSSFPFLLTGKELRAITSSPPTGTFRLTYLQRIVPMMADADECYLDGEYHQAVIREAAYDIAIAFGKYDLAERFRADIARWEAEIVRDARHRNFRHNEVIQDVMGWGADGDGSCYPLGW